jgi:hypothetical protein
MSRGTLLRRSLRFAIVGLLLVGGAFCLEAQTLPRPVQVSAATALVGTWHRAPQPIVDFFGDRARR